MCGFLLECADFSLPVFVYYSITPVTVWMGWGGVQPTRHQPCSAVSNRF